MRRRGQDGDVGHFTGARRVQAVDFDEDFVGAVEVGGGSADGGGEVDAALGGDLGGFDDGEIDLAEEAGEDGLREGGRGAYRRTRPCRS